MEHKQQQQQFKYSNETDSCSAAKTDKPRDKLVENNSDFVLVEQKPIQIQLQSNCPLDSTNNQNKQQQQNLLLAKDSLNADQKLEGRKVRSQTSGQHQNQEEVIDETHSLIGHQHQNNHQRIQQQQESVSNTISANIERFCCCSSCCGCCCGVKLRSIRRHNTMIESMRLISAYFFAELLGTFMLVIIGDGTIASYVLSRREIDMFTACFAFGVGAMIATFVAAKISGAHINPAATVAFALDGKLKWKLVPVYICAQYLGGFLAALVLFVNYAEAINSFGDRTAFGSNNSTGHIFATYPGPWTSVWGSLLDQIIGTAVLLFSLSAVCDKNNAGLEDRHQPFIIALVIGLTCVAFNPNCGAIFNPARDLSPRLLTYLFGYPSVWSPIDGLYWLTAGVLGPHIGAIVGVFTYKLLIGRSLVNKREYELNGTELDGQNPLDRHNNHYHHHQLEGSILGACCQTSAFSAKQQNQPMGKFTQHQHHRDHHHHHHHHDSSGGTGTNIDATNGSQIDNINYGSATPLRK